MNGALYDMYNTFDKDGNLDQRCTELLTSGDAVMDVDFGFASNLLLPVELTFFNAALIEDEVEIR
ncbi:MAG: hypothetical protein OEQ53_02775, partial [Saprospiraceae bacterium]|nr:hypothetical protein [Saprospiraceae bacterium]